MLSPNSFFAKARLTWWRAFAILAVIFFTANLPLLVGWANGRWDVPGFFLPFYSFLSRTLRSGHWLFWDPFCNGGSPDFAEPQIGAFSPVTLFFALVAGPSPEAFRIYWLTLWFFGGAGMLVLGRSLGAPVWGGLIGALSYVFSGIFIGHGQHTSVIYSCAFLPWIFWRLDFALRRGSWIAAAQAGALWGMSAIGGNPAITISTSLFLGMTALAPVLANPARRSWSTQAKTYFEMLFLFAAVGSVVLLPTYFSFLYETVGFTDRSGPLPRDFVLNSNPFPASGIIAIFNPYMPLIAVSNRMWPNTHVSCGATYFGAVALVLGLFTLTDPARRKWAAIFFGATILSLGFSLAQTLPLRGWLYDLVPPTRYFRHPSMFRAYFVFGMIVLAMIAAIRIDTWREEGSPNPRRLTSLMGIAAVLGALGVGSYLWLYIHTTNHGPLGTVSLIHAIGCWVLLAGLVWFIDRRPDWLNRLPMLLTIFALIDLIAAHFLSSEIAFGFGPQAQATVTGSPIDLGPEGFLRAYKVAGNEQLTSHRPVLSSYTAMLNQTHKEYVETPLLAGMALGRNRIWFSAQAPEVPLTTAAFSAFKDRVEKEQQPFIVRHSRDSLLKKSVVNSNYEESIATLSPAIRVSFEVIDYRPNHLQLDLEAPSAGWVLITDRWSRSWTAQINGADVPIDGGNFLFRMVPVQKGRNVITMKFRPFLIPHFVVISWGTLAVIGILTLRSFFRRDSTMPPVNERSMNVSRETPCGASS